MSWRLRLMRNGPGQTIRRIGRAVTKAAQALTTDLIRSTTEDEQEAEVGDLAQSADEDDVEDRGEQSGDGDRADHSRQEDDTDEDSDEESDTSTVGTSAKIRLRRRHKRRFYQSRDEVYAHQYVYRILAESGIYQEPKETSEGECGQDRAATFPLVETTLAVLRAMRTLDAENRKHLMTRLASIVSDDARPSSPSILYR